MGIGGEPEVKRLILQEQRFQKDCRRRRRRPYEGVAGRDHAGVAPGRPLGNPVGLLEDGDRVAVLLKLVGGGDADHAAAQNQDLHSRTCIVAPSRWSSLPAIRRPRLSTVNRSEERRVGKECVSTCSSRWSPYH